MQAEAVPRRAVNLSASAEILRAAREARLNLSAVLERALIGELARVRRARWREENALAVLVYNEYVASHGMCFQGRSGA
jgi:antitoxin CcdA